MNRKHVIFALALAMFVALAFASVARAQIKGSIQVKDSESNIINGGTVYINTVAYVHGHYEDLGGNAQASGLMEVYYNDGSGLALEATLYSGTVDDEATITQTFTMSKLGTYEFRWTCQVGQPGTLGLLRCDEKTQARTTIQLVVPEPGTLAGLGMALAALGFLAAKRTRLK